MASHTLQEKQSCFLVQNCIWGPTSVTGHIFLDVSSQDIFNVFLLKFAFHYQLVITINGTNCSQFSKQKGQQMLGLPMKPAKKDEKIRENGLHSC
jgi:hypothetical protein